MVHEAKLTIFRTASISRWLQNYLKMSFGSSNPNHLWLWIIMWFRKRRKMRIKPGWDIILTWNSFQTYNICIRHPWSCSINLQFMLYQVLNAPDHLLNRSVMIDPHTSTTDLLILFWLSSFDFEYFDLIIQHECFLILLISSKMLKQ